jgi:hypothetical protein
VRASVNNKESGVVIMEDIKIKSRMYLGIKYHAIKINYIKGVAFKKILSW